jgi:hypothetical protein
MHRHVLPAALAAICSAGFATDFGVDNHLIGAPGTNDTIAAIMKARNLRTLRTDLIWSADQTALRDQITRIRANGGRAEVSLQTDFQWDNSCPTNLAAVEQTAYSQSVAAVTAMKDLVQEFELLNETQLRPEITREVPWNTAGTSTTPYVGKRCVASLTAALRGMSRGVHDAGGRVILGTVGRDFGFLTYMSGQGVTWDITGFHIYPHLADPSLASDPR